MQMKTEREWKEQQKGIEKYKILFVWTTKERQTWNKYGLENANVMNRHKADTEILYFVFSLGIFSFSATLIHIDDNIRATKL